jgi:hypothetical protein
MTDAQQVLRSLAERLCQVRTGTEAEIRAALAVPTAPAPLGARDLVITAGALSVAAVDLKFASPAFTRADLDAIFGDAQTMPRTGPNAAHVLSYSVAGPGAPARVSVFARFFEPPQPSTGARTLFLRIDPA